MKQHANDVMDRLFALSPQDAWLDCARSYGLSEKFVGEYLKANNIKPDHVHVSSKWGYTVSASCYCCGAKVVPTTDKVFLISM
jgi:aryl-alcohol dehydrogenase-like predicted oxidoreductase